MKKNSKKNSKKYYCKNCDFYSKNKNDFRRHLSTRKHNLDNMDNMVDNKKNSTPCFVCECGNKYKYRSGLSKHKKKCITTQEEINIQKKHNSHTYSNETDNEDAITTELFSEVLKQNNVLIEKILELSKEKKIINYQNCNNKKMTINVFLNEKCKDAMNLTDFVENVKVSLEDLIYTKEHGYVEGISNIFVKHLQDMKPTERPIHCSDKKRLQFYVKEADVWEKDKTHEKIDKSIKDVTFKQIKKIKEWEKQHPNFMNNDKLLEEWHTMLQKMMGGEGNVECIKNQEQIKKSLCNSTEIKEYIATDK